MIKPKIKLGVKPSRVVQEPSPMKIPIQVQVPLVPPSIPASGVISVFSPQTSSNDLLSLNEHLKEIVENNVFFVFIELLRKISDDYRDQGLSFQVLQERYLSSFKTHLKNSEFYSKVLSLDINDLTLPIGTQSPPMDETKIPTRHEPPSDPIVIQQVELPSKGSRGGDGVVGGTISPSTDKCLARTCNNTQCSRKRQKNGIFCGNHAQTQPFGRIDQSLTSTPSTSDLSFTKKPSTNLTPEIEAVIEIFGGISYVVDQQTGNIYKRKDNCDFGSDEVCLDDLRLVGRKMEDNTVVWYSNTDLLFLNKKI